MMTRRVLFKFCLCLDFVFLSVFYCSCVNFRECYVMFCFILHNKMEQFLYEFAVGLVWKNDISRKVCLGKSGFLCVILCINIRKCMYKYSKMCSFQIQCCSNSFLTLLDDDWNRNGFPYSDDRKEQKIKRISNDVLVVEETTVKNLADKWIYDFDNNFIVIENMIIYHVNNIV